MADKIYDCESCHSFDHDYGGCNIPSYACPYEKEFETTIEYLTENKRAIGIIQERSTSPPRLKSHLIIKDGELIREIRDGTY